MMLRNAKFATLFVFLLLLSFSSSSYAGKWDLEFWQTFNWTNWEKGPYKLYSVCEVRLDKDISTFYYTKLGENFAYQALPCLNLEAHYSFIRHKAIDATLFKNTNRLEFEINPSMQFENSVALVWRNRLELIKKQDDRQVRSVFRHRITAVYPLNDWGRLTAYQCSDEIFYDLNTKKFTQNRFMPLGLTFTFTPKVSLDTYVLIRNFYTQSINKWHKSIVLGSALNF